MTITLVCFPKFQCTHFVDILEEPDDSDIESDNRKLLLGTTNDTEDEFLSHLVKKYTTNTPMILMTALGKHFTSSEGQRMGDYELWEVPTQVCQEHISQVNNI